MSVIAFLLDGHWSSTPPPVPITLCVFVAPMATLLCCYLLAKKRRFVGYALAVATVSAVVLLAPMYKMLLNSYDAPYDMEDVLVLLAAVGIPFFAVGVFYFYPPGAPNNSCGCTSSGVTPSPVQEVRN